MINENLFNDICVFIKEIFQLDDDSDVVLSKDTSFCEDLFADPEDFIELGFILEEEFGVQLPVDSFDTMETVGDLVDYVSEQMEMV